MDDAPRHPDATPNDANGLFTDQFDPSATTKPSGELLSPDAARFYEQDREAIDDFNKWYALHGSPPDEFRTF